MGMASDVPRRALLQKKKNRERLLLVTFSYAPGIEREAGAACAKQHEINQTDLINEAIELNLQRYSLKARERDAIKILVEVGKTCDRQAEDSLSKDQALSRI